MKIITVCGSLKFKDDIIEAALQLELKNNIALIPIFPNRPLKTKLTAEEIQTLNVMHQEKIKFSDAILVVDINGYIGESTYREIELAKTLDKEIIYYSNLNQELL